VFWKQLSILGTTMGSPSDFAAMTELVTTRAIHPIVSQVFPLDEVAAAFDLLAQGAQFGKIVVRL
jgi:zinc-binding alcohol dehydrogenase/oxidoreductase